MSELRNATLLFLIKKENDKITNICLAMKKRGFGINRWNGVGGKVEPNETIECAAIRETKEEIGVDVSDLQKVAELSFYFPHNKSFNQKVHVYHTENWNGEPTESEEMAPKWFSISDIPFTDMWPDDIHWLHKMIEGKSIKAMFKFGEGDIIIEQLVELIDDL